ncbi:MAG: TonB-dependent receptor [Gemmatimonadota bacterium]|nr:MAG: TonB-dependent receptor [Gemmatimonadota bacterium]
MFTKYSSVLKYTVCVVLLMTTSLPSNAQEAPQSQQERKSPLELPDVIVYGVDTDLRKTGEKTSAAKFSILALSSDAPAPYPSLPSCRGVLTIPGSRQSSPGHATFLSSYVGSYSSWGLQAIHNRTLKRAHLRLFSDIQGTNGAFDKSVGTWGEIEGRVDGPLSNTITGGLQAGYRRWSYGLHGSPKFLGKFRQELLTIQTHMDYRHSQHTLSHFSFAYRLLNVPQSLYDVYENLFRGEFTVQTELGPFGISSHLHWTGDRPSVENINEPQDFNLVVPDYPSSDLLGLSIVSKVPLLPQFSADMGVDVYVFSRERQDDETRLFPKLRCLYRPLAPVAIQAYLGGNFRHRSLVDLHEANPYAVPSISSIVSAVEEVRLKVGTEVEVEVRPDLFLKGAYRWTRILDELYWRWECVSEFYTSFRLEEVRQHRIDLSCNYRPAENITIETGLTWLDYGIKDRYISIANPSAKIPFRPNNQAWGIVTFDIPGIVDIRGDWRWVGGRTAFLPLPFDSFHDTLELDPYFLLNLTLEKNIHRAITLFTSIYNLTDSDYEVWYNYPEMGIHFHGGLKIVF